MTNSRSPAVEAGTLTALLRHFDWSRTSQVPGVFEVWVPDDSANEEILLPLDPDRGDYWPLLERARDSIFMHYGQAARDVSAVLEMQERASLEATHWKRETNLDAGLINWWDGEKLYASARAQLIASAKSTKKKRRYHGNASAHVAKRFLEGSYMGQTAVGSFIITAYTPADERFHTSVHSEEIHQSRPRESEIIYGREILTTFETALKAVRSGLEEYKKRPRVELFLDTVEEGVSYEFAKALSEITAGSDSEIQIMRHSAEAGRQSTTNIAFDAVDSPVLVKVANRFAQDSEPQDVTLRGEVTLLSRQSGAPGRLIRLNVARGAGIRKARIRLSEEQYRLAMEAHRDEVSIEVSGELTKDGNLYWLTNPRNISLVPNEEDSHGGSGSFHSPTIFEDD